MNSIFLYFFVKYFVKSFLKSFVKDVPPPLVLDPLSRGGLMTAGTNDAGVEYTFILGRN